MLFLDEIDSITQKRENASKDMERRIVSQLLTCMDGELLQHYVYYTKIGNKFNYLEHCSGIIS